MSQIENKNHDGELPANLQFPKDLHGVHVHFVGIKGTGMAALVEIFFHNGAVVTGSDVKERFYTDEILEKLNIVPTEFSASNITDDIQYVIYSSAYKLDVNPELIEATRRKLPCLMYTQALGLYSSLAYSCGICGVHGKTSTTGLVGTILKEIDDIPSQILAGSVINSFGGTCTYTSPLISTVPEQEKKTKSIFVAETCEYQRHFMSFFPKKIILTSVESDHEDYYPTYDDIRDAFVDYICKLPMFGELIYCADDPGAVETALIAYNKRPDIHMVPYGVNAGGDYKLTFGIVQNERNEFSLGIFNKTLALKMPGKHEVTDAAAAVALVCQILRYFGKHPADYVEKIAKGLENFSGGKRRSEIVRTFKTPKGNDVIVMDDYGHHPTAIKTTLEGYREFYKGRKIIIDFMSHTYSRTQALLDDFAASMDSADVVILHKIYSSARENAEDFNISGRTLYEKTIEHQKQAETKASKHNAIYYTQEILDAKSIAEMELEKKLPPEYPDGYLFVTMGAGDNWKLGKEIFSGGNI
ncbi:MAG: UDP-N-acetylmuramate--L-alanine ligase [Treponema sp.]|nr:UDP-N-acetylmuramate--L-alanine ligase [Treponema sp.]